MADFITILVLLVLIGGALGYIIKEKKRGVRCIGCSLGGCCGGNCSCGADIDADAILAEIKTSGACSCKSCNAENESTR